MIPIPTLAEMWATFERHGVPSAAGPTQRSEMRRAFYTGLLAMMEAVDALGMNKPSHEESIATAQGWLAELRQVIGRGAIAP